MEKLDRRTGASENILYADLHDRYGYSFADNFADRSAKSADNGMLFCVGSLYLVGEIKDVIRRNKK